MPIPDHTPIPDWSDDDGCPVHSTQVRKRYSFGRCQDAEVYVFRGCRCAVSVNVASLTCGVPLGHECQYHASYDSAAGRARLIAAEEEVWDRTVGF